MTANYSNLVYLHDILQSILERDVTFVMTLLQVHVKDNVLKWVSDVRSSKEYLLPNKRKVDVMYMAYTQNGKRLCIGFEVKTGNDISEEQLSQEIEGLRSMEVCDKSFFVLIAKEDPSYDIPYYFIPLSAFRQKVSDVLKIAQKLLDLVIPDKKETIFYEVSQKRKG